MACTPGAGWEKGQVEKQVGDLRGRLFARSPRGRSYAEINEWLMDRCIENAKKQPHPTIEGKTVWQVFEEERPFLMAYRGPFRRLPRQRGGGVQDLSGALRQQPVQRGSPRRRAAGGRAGLCRSDRHPPGRRDRRRASPQLLMLARA